MASRHLIGSLVFLGLMVANSVDVPQVADLIGLFSRSSPTSAGPISLTQRNCFWVQYGELELNIRRRSDDRFTPITCDMVAVLCLLRRIHVLPSLEQLLPPFLVPLTLLEHPTATDGLCWHHGHDHHLILPPNLLYFPVRAPLAIIYLGRITAMGMFTVVTLLAPSLSSGKFWAFQAMLFLSLGLFGIVPAIHACIVSWSDPQHPITLAYESAMALSYITGTLFYVSRIPERLKPGWSDVAGHSNRIFHIFVIMGKLAHYGATLLLLQWQDKSWVR